MHWAGDGLIRESRAGLEQAHPTAARAAEGQRDFRIADGSSFWLRLQEGGHLAAWCIQEGGHDLLQQIHTDVRSLLIQNDLSCSP